MHVPAGEALENTQLRHLTNAAVRAALIGADLHRRVAVEALHCKCGDQVGAEEDSQYAERGQRYIIEAVEELADSAH